ncbi:hypothetical protein CORC01_05514 [Colletotrichum orchidophilum]|uniref:Myb-like DNA-binding domain-containing protein n=1 Tax=Colletotrichum orchidophilum TaxID=1209926 RepID=A0A1G4BCW0_9PEZI|nr:uncharacterized protein CORC01_05514 [Colletotrichum orchidophilum]OHE99233.1 hypothetical protein CORC01_05514 [Colletotrichum orchidophilum]
MADQTTPEVTLSDASFMVQIFKHMTEKPVIDWESFAEAAGFKNASVAQTRYGQIKRKFTQPGDPAYSTPKKTTQASASTPTSGSKIKKTTGRVGVKGKTGKKAVKDEDNKDEADGMDTDDKTIIKTEDIKFKEETLDI